MRSALIVAITLCGATRAAAQKGIPVRGHLSMADEAVVLEPCGTFEPYSLAISGEIGNELTDALENLAGPAHRRVFVEMEGWMDTGPITRASSGFEGTWIPTRIAAIRPEVVTDCSGEPPPLWHRPGCERLSPPDLDCLPADLVESDLQLARYVTEAMTFASDAGELAIAQAAWKRNRELRCVATRPGGNVDELWVLSCRLGMSRARLIAIWEEYLQGTATALPDPRTGARAR
jgi:uncharacterized protein YecT (DUF1311 family)